MSWKDDIIESLKFGIVDMFVLLLLSEKDIYGYQIKKEIEGRTNKVFTFKEGTLYGPLYRLEERGFISSRKEPSGKRFIKYYHIEPSGREYLEFTLKNYEEITDATKAFITMSKEKANNEAKEWM